jgi:hypothetical protein
MSGGIGGGKFDDFGAAQSIFSQLVGKIGETKNSCFASISAPDRAVTEPIGDVDDLSTEFDFRRLIQKDRHPAKNVHTRLALLLRASANGASFLSQIKRLMCCKTASTATPAEDALGREASHFASAFSVTA